jgi:hypothetical protein
MLGPYTDSQRTGCRRRPAGIALLLLLCVLLAASATGCRKHAPVLEDLNGVAQLKARFNRDEGKPRVVLLLSPT